MRNDFTKTQYVNYSQQATVELQMAPWMVLRARQASSASIKYWFGSPGTLSGGSPRPDYDKNAQLIDSPAAKIRKITANVISKTQFHRSQQKSGSIDE